MGCIRIWRWGICRGRECLANFGPRKFEINREANLDAVHVTIVYHEDYDELLIEIQKWEKLFKDNSDLIFLGRSYKDIEKADKENKTAIFFFF